MPTVFGSLLADAVRESYAEDSGAIPRYQSRYQSESKDECKEPAEGEASITAIMDRHREEKDARAALELARECTRDFVRREMAAAKQEGTDLIIAKRLEGEYKDESLARRNQRAYDLEKFSAEFAEQDDVDRDARFAAALEDACKADAAAAEDAAEAKDSAGAASYQRRVDRQDHRARMDRRAAAEAKDDGQTAGERWANALGAFDLEDVGGAIVISLRLPDLVNVSVKPMDKRFVLLQASRAKPLGSRNDKTEDGPTALKLKLELESPGCCLRPEDLSHDYCSASGYLHIYCENLKLATLSDRSAATATSERRKRVAASLRDHAAAYATRLGEKVRSAVTRAPAPRKIDAV